eukprot:11898-Rhodomonas_salina.1
MAAYSPRMGTASPPTLPLKFRAGMWLTRQSRPPAPSIPLRACGASIASTGHWAGGPGTSCTGRGPSP